MAESFKYKRLEVSKLLFQSWGEYKILLGRKKYESSTYSFMFYPFPTFSQFHKMEKGRRKNFLLLKEYKAGYCLYDGNIWYWTLNQGRYKSDHPDSRIGCAYTNEISRKKEFIKKISQIVESFNEKGKYNIFDFPEKTKIPFKNYNHLIYILPMLSLTSAILEGTLREILAKYLQEEINKHVEIGNKEGRTQHNNYQKLIVAKQSLIESHSSISSLMSEYSIIFDLKSSEIIPKNLGNIITSLNTLRNIVAHGTSIVTTNIRVQEDDYFKNWNRKIDDLQKVLKKYFGSEDVYLNLSDYRLADFYMACVLHYLSYILAKLRGYDESMDKALKNIKMVEEIEKVSDIKIKYNQEYLNWFE